jgi:hypothetical protein
MKQPATKNRMVSILIETAILDELDKLASRQFRSRSSLLKDGFCFPPDGTNSKRAA